MKKLLLLVSSIILLSCTTNENSIESSSTNIEASTSFSKVYNNVGNPYESVGERHNAFINHFYYNNGPDDLNGTIDMGVNFFSQEYNIVLPDNITTDNIANTVQYSIDHSITENIQHLRNEGSISDLSFAYLTRLANYIENPIEAEGIDGFINKIENLEIELIVANLPDSDKQFLLSTISIAKYSSNYWKEVYEQPSSVILKTEPTAWQKAKIAIHVAGVDMNAYIKGAIIFLPGAELYSSIASANEQRRIDKLWGK